MPKTKGGRKIRHSVNVPDPMYQAIEDIIEKRKVPESYISVDDFVRDAIRLRLKELKPLEH